MRGPDPDGRGSREQEDLVLCRPEPRKVGLGDRAFCSNKARIQFISVYQGLKQGAIKAFLD